jgi:hypothetical protein
VDPLADQYAPYSPYNYVLGNPIRLIDPTGKAPEDKITVNSNGFITNKEVDDQPNTFYDQNGNVLTFNDADIADNLMLEANYNVGERLFHNVSNDKYSNAITEAGVEEDRGPLSTAWASYQGADFAENYLAGEADIQMSNDTPRGQNFSGNQAFFKFEDSEVIYNLYDAGNHMWGTWMRANGWSREASLLGADINDFLNDSDADQRAIGNGWDYDTIELPNNRD